MIITIDIESYYDQTTYSLTKLREAAYILDPRFEVLMMSIKVDDKPTHIFEGDARIRQALSRVDWERVALAGHNLRFDGAILAWHYGVVPKLYLDTMAMARATIFAHTGRVSLEATAKYLGLPEKGKEVLSASGKHRADFTDAEWAAYKKYCIRDTDITKLALNRLVSVLPRSELKVIDATVRMFVEPQVQLDRQVLGKHLFDVRLQKKTILERAGLTKDLLSSNEQFARWLVAHGIEVPMKTSRATGQPTYSLAKTDRAFKELCQREDLPYEVEVALQARIEAKSTGEETRTEALLTVSALDWGDSRQSGSWSPVPLRYYGARTGRFSGDGGFNWQNFKRTSRIREAIIAPSGYLIVHRDASQIEARMVADLADCKIQKKAFRDPKRDIYCEFASRDIYHRPITKNDKLERFVGKTAILSLGYSCGHHRFREALFIGNGGVAVSVSEEQARDIVINYRQRFADIPVLWRRGDNLLSWMAAVANRLSIGNMAEAMQMGMPYYPVVDIDYDAVRLPNGMAIQYPGLRVKPDPNRPWANAGFAYDDPYLGEQSMYGGKFLENISQALCRIIITDIIERVRKSTGYYPFLTTHDSLDYCVPIEDAEKFDQLLAVEFAKPPTWAPKLPLASEGGWGRTLAAAERGEGV